MRAEKSKRGSGLCRDHLQIRADWTARGLGHGGGRGLKNPFLAGDSEAEAAERFVTALAAGLLTDEECPPFPASRAAARRSHRRKHHQSAAVVWVERVWSEALAA